MYHPTEAEMVTFKEAEEQYGVKRATLYRYIQQGQLLAYHRGLDKRSYVRRSDLEALRRFGPRRRNHAPDMTWIDRAQDFQRRTFGDQVFATPSSDLINEARRERIEQLP
jgi:hypothetical protein